MNTLTAEQVSEYRELAEKRPERPEWLNYIRISARTFLGTRKPADYLIAFGPAGWGIATSEPTERKAESRRNSIVDWLWMWIEKDLAAARTAVPALCDTVEELRSASYGHAEIERLRKEMAAQGIELAELQRQNAELLAGLKDLVAHHGGGRTACGHEHHCICAGDNARDLIAKYGGTK